MNKFKRTLEEITKEAVLHWPDEMLSDAGEEGVLPLLLKTQDTFLAILKVSTKDPLSWKTTVENNSEITGPLFLKHLMVLSDLGGEPLSKLPPLNKYLPNNSLNFEWNGRPYEYKLKKIGQDCSLKNNDLKVSSRQLIKMQDKLNEKGEDVCMLLLYGSSLISDSLPSEVKDKCTLGQLIGNLEALDQFVKQRYLYVSRQVSGATANALGQRAQVYVADKLVKLLGKFWEVKVNGTLPGVFHKEGGNGTNFDIVVRSPNNIYFGVEISFQVTTNSTIERKARESESNMKAVHSQGHKICYVIDGAGNIKIRKSAVQTLCDHSDCTVAMSDSEIEYLADYFKLTSNEKKEN